VKIGILNHWLSIFVTARALFFFKTLEYDHLANCTLMQQKPYPPFYQNNYSPNFGQIFGKNLTQKMKLK
jgi:hypothetical protein